MRPSFASSAIARTNDAALCTSLRIAFSRSSNRVSGNVWSCTAKAVTLTIMATTTRRARRRGMVSRPRLSEGLIAWFGMSFFIAWTMLSTQDGDSSAMPKPARWVADGQQCCRKILTKPLHLLAAAGQIAVWRRARSESSAASNPADGLLSWLCQRGGARVLQACVLAAVAGYADTIGFLRFDAFAGLMTGNTILLGIGLASAQLLRAAFYGAIIGVFVAGILHCRALHHLSAPPPRGLVLTPLPTLHFSYLLPTHHTLH